MKFTGSFLAIHFQNFGYFACHGSLNADHAEVPVSRTSELCRLKFVNFLFWEDVYSSILREKCAPQFTTSCNFTASSSFSPLAKALTWCETLDGFFVRLWLSVWCCSHRHILPYRNFVMSKSRRKPLVLFV